MTNPTDPVDMPPDAGRQAESPPATIRRHIATAWYHVTSTMNIGATTVFVGAVSLIGADVLISVLSLTAMWPIAAPLVLSVLAVVYVLRRRLRVSRERPCVLERLRVTRRHLRRGAKRR